MKKGDLVTIKDSGEKGIVTKVCGQIIYIKHSYYKKGFKYHRTQIIEK